VLLNSSLVEFEYSLYIMNTIKADHRMIGPRIHLPSCQSAHPSYEQRKILKSILAYILVIEDRTDVFELNFILPL